MDDYDRRHFIRTSLPGFLGLTMALPSLTALATRANACQGRLSEMQTINWDAFLEAVEKEATRQHLDDWDTSATRSSPAQTSPSKEAWSVPPHAASAEAQTSAATGICGSVESSFAKQ